MKNLSAQEGKTLAIVSYITIIGWVVAYLLNKRNNSSFANFHLRQSIGIHLAMILISYFHNFKFFFFNVKNIAPKLGLVFLIIGFYYAIRGEEKLIPWIGKTFQDWFKSI